MPLIFFTAPNDHLRALLYVSGEEALSKRQKLKKSALVVLQEYATKVSNLALSL
jgi:hypothetical protein